MKVLKLVGCLAFLGAAPLLQAGDVAAGKQIAGRVCIACHGATGKSTNPMYPNLGGQSEPYLASSIRAYKAGDRSGGMSAVMKPMVSALSDADINNVAAYYAAQSPCATPPAK